MSVGIDDKVIQELVTHLTASCITGIVDSSKVGLIRQGPLQDDPEAVEDGISILIYVNDPSSPKQWPHIRDELQEIADGYSQYWIRRYTIQVLCQFTRLGYTDTQAQATANEVFSRVQMSLVKLGDTLLGVADDFGEHVYAPCNGVSKISITKGGGPPNEYTWEAHYGIEVKTYQKAT